MTAHQTDTYDRYQKFLPPFDVTVNLVMERLATVYKCFLAEGGMHRDNKVIQKWLEQVDNTDTSCGKQSSYYKVLRYIIDDTLSQTEVSFNNEEFLMRIKDECDSYGYENYERPEIIMVEEVYSVRLALLNEIQFYIEYLDTCELGERSHS